MTFTQITCYQCDDCKTTFMSLPEFCSQCASTGKHYSGQVIGPFVLHSKLNGSDKWIVSCRLCGNNSEISTSNLRRQKSCGCARDSLLKIIKWEEDLVTVKCTRCGLIKNYDINRGRPSCAVCGSS